MRKFEFKLNLKFLLLFFKPKIKTIIADNRTERFLS